MLCEKDQLSSRVDTQLMAHYLRCSTVNHFSEETRERQRDQEHQEPLNYVRLFETVLWSGLSLIHISADIKKHTFVFVREMQRTAKSVDGIDVQHSFASPLCQRDNIYGMSVAKLCRQRFSFSIHRVFLSHLSLSSLSVSSPKSTIRCCRSERERRLRDERWDFYCICQKRLKRPQTEWFIFAQQSTSAADRHSRVFSADRNSLTLSYRSVGVVSGGRVSEQKGS